MNGEQAAAAPAADSQSIESRVGNIFGAPQEPPQPKQPPQRQQVPIETQAPDETTDQAPAIEDATSDPPQGEDPTAPQYEEVEFEGETYQVPPKLKEAFIRQADYTKKTQAVAEKERLIAHREEQQRAVQMNYDYQLSVQPQMLELSQIEQRLAQYDSVNWRALPPDERNIHLAEMNTLERAQIKLKTELDAKKQEHEQRFTEQLHKLQADAADVLKKRIPNWSPQAAKEVSEWALTNGFTQAEISAISDPRHAEVLWKAAQYDKARSSAKPAVAQAKAVKTTSSNPMPSHVKEMLNFRNQVKKAAPGSVQQKQLVESRVGAMFAKRER